ncbi:MAG TPA: hypothetical protein EYP22_00855 [Methanosarcinales archaeon]|nr:hypothetical protein [Methanosarcinales archaeon]
MKIPSLGDIILYISLIIGIVAVIGIILKEFKDNNIFSSSIPWLLRVSASLMVFDMVLLGYYFLKSDFRYIYVWQFSSLDLPTGYKISAVLAGQPGTYLFWALVIFISALWISETKKWQKGIIRKSQIITLLIGLYFIILTLLDSPFKTIYEEEPTLPLGFVPPDGNGLNPLLIDPWMAVHPPIMFLAYGVMTIPFSLAIVYLFTGDKRWESFVRQWSRVSWLFLTLGIAIGGYWSYTVLGWGGFWAWDPVETASLVPWFALTGFLHALSQHRKNQNKFSIAAPMLASLSFILVVYTALVTRSGLWESIHAFGSATTGSLLAILVAVSAIISLILGIIKYAKKEKEKEIEIINKNKTSSLIEIINKTNLFYVTILIFIILAFISFWGITFPVLMRLIKNVKVGIGMEFFNIWSYPFTILLLLTAGFCLDYSKKHKNKSILTLLVVIAFTVILAFIEVSPTFYVIDHTSPFFVSQPLFYKIIGSISMLSLFPPIVYIASSAIIRLYKDSKLSKLKIKSIGVNIIHIGVAFILFGAVISVAFSSSMGANIRFDQKGDLVEIPEGDGYGIKLVDIKYTSSYSYPGTKISEIKNHPNSFIGRQDLQISGKVTQVQNTEHATYFELYDGSDKMWIATSNIDIHEGIKVTAKGFLMTDFKSNSTGQVFDVILFSFEVQPLSMSGSSTRSSQKVDLEIYKDKKKIGSGSAEYIQYAKGGDVTNVMIDSSLTKDIYVIFQGTGSGVVPLTIKIMPFINELWIGIILFSLGIILIMIAEVKKRARK